MRARAPWWFTLAAVAGLPLLAAAGWSVERSGAGATAPLGGATTVSSMTELESALRSARDGDVVEMVAGAYPFARIRGVRVDGTVTVRPAPGAAVVLAGLDLRDVAGLTLSGLTFRGDPAPGRYQLLVTGGERVRLESMAFDGAEEGGDRRIVSSVMLRDVRDAVVRDSRFTGGWHGLSLLNVDGLLVEGNTFRGLETDGVRGGGVNHAVIARNSFTDFHPRDGDHPDGIQLWSTRQDTPARDIVIRENLVVRGHGAPTQGVFVRDTHLKLPFEGLVVRDNLVVGGLYNGITVAGATAPVIQNNTVLSQPDHDSWIRLSDATQARVTGNQAMRFVEAKTTFAVRANNRTVSAITSSQAAQVIAEWNRRTARRPDDASLNDLGEGE